MATKKKIGNKIMATGAKTPQPGNEKLEPPMNGRVLNVGGFASKEEKRAYETLFVKKGYIDGCVDSSGDVVSYFDLRGSRAHCGCEAAIKYAIENKFTGKFMEAAVDAMIACRKETKYDAWSHSVCHLFEQIGIIFETGRTDLIKKLVDESVQGAIDSNNISSTGRTIGGLFNYNWTRIDASNLGAPLALTFESLKDERFVKMLKEPNCAKYNMAQIALCTSATQKELVLNILKNPDACAINVAKRTELLIALSAEIGEAEADKLFQAAIKNQDLTLTVAADNLKSLKTAKQSEDVAGVFVDVDGTLMIDGKLNTELVDGLAECRRKHKTMTIRIFTGGDPKEKERILKRFKKLEGIFEFPVLSKSDFVGKTLETVIDDTVPEIQGFKAKRYLGRDDFYPLLDD